MTSGQPPAVPTGSQESERIWSRDGSFNWRGIDPAKAQARLAELRARLSPRSRSAEMTEARLLLAMVSALNPSAAEEDLVRNWLK